jgi:hypothetical protein
MGGASGVGCGMVSEAVGTLVDVFVEPSFYSRRLGFGLACSRIECC